MSSSDAFAAYLRELRRDLATGAATEHTHRPALKALLERLGDGVRAINEPKRIECGAPDYIITRVGTPVGYVEAKNVGANLDVEARSEQLRRYRASLSNLILTDYLGFRWYVEGEHRETVRLASLTRDGKVKGSKAGVQAVADVFDRFFAQEVPTIGRPKELAQRMASLARMIRNLVEETFERETERGMLHAQLKAFRETLIPDLTPAQFADMYAQTITYGLFAARVRMPRAKDFTRENAAWRLPPTNPFLRDLFNEIAGPRLDERVAWAVDDLAHLLAHADMAEVLKDFGKATKQQDPVVHFYETFLGAYDPEMKQTRGVYYTPEPVVDYIVRSLDYLVKTRFGRPLGLGDSQVLILDPSCGTGTFLYFVIQQIHETVAATVGEGAWSSYVAEDLLPTVFGFELLMAPCAVAHMKLGMLLEATGYDFRGDQRLGIYLTNSLEEAITKAETLGFARFITEEANAAAEVKKEKPIMVVLGNPPYSVSSANREEVYEVDQSGRRHKVKTHIGKLMERYKEAVRDERNIQPLSDDYIKFIRFAHDRIERTGYGIVGMITNHSYLSGLIHRGMREELMKTFDVIYLLNLHGHSGEAAPDGGPDENVFDIRQGVAIAIFEKNREGEGIADVKYADLWGVREGKYRYLLENDASTSEWQTLEPLSPYFFFVPKEFDLLGEYERGWSIAEIFPVNCGGIKTHRDHFVIDFEEDSLRSRIAALRNETLSDNEIRHRFKLQDSQSWRLAEARSKLRAQRDLEENFKRCLYRPFDIRWICYSADLIDRPRRDVMRHLLHTNLALLAVRQVTLADMHAHFGASRLPVDNRAFYSTRGIVNVFPVYLYIGPKDVESTLFAGQELIREPNLSAEFIVAVADKLVLDFVADGKGDFESTFGPEDIFHYAYAVFHSPTYRERYAEFLKIDFPRLPLTSDLKLFRALAEKGEELVALHLMESPKLSQLITKFPVRDTNEVVKVRYAEPREEVPGRVYINKTQHFEGVEPNVWEFQVGGHQVLNKWLKDRKGRVLSFEDLFHYQKIVVALKETMRLMEEVDRVIEVHGGWPIE